MYRVRVASCLAALVVSVTGCNVESKPLASIHNESETVLHLADQYGNNTPSTRGTLAPGNYIVIGVVSYEGRCKNVRYTATTEDGRVASRLGLCAGDKWAIKNSDLTAAPTSKP